MQSFEESLDCIKDALIITTPERTLHSADPFDIAYDLGIVWRDWTLLAQRQLIRSNRFTERTAALCGSMEEGLHVALFGLGQVVRQNNLRDQAPTPEVAKARLVSGALILEHVAAQDVDTAFTIEQTYGFRAERFEEPKADLRMYGTSVELRDTPPTVNTPARGCPFRRQMGFVYPLIGNMLIPAMTIKQ